MTFASTAFGSYSLLVSLQVSKAPTLQALEQYFRPLKIQQFIFQALPTVTQTATFQF